MKKRQKKLLKLIEAHLSWEEKVPDEELLPPEYCRMETIIEGLREELLMRTTRRYFRNNVIEIINLLLQANGHHDVELEPITYDSERLTEEERVRLTSVLRDDRKLDLLRLVELLRQISTRMEQVFNGADSAEAKAGH